MVRIEGDIFEESPEHFIRDRTHSELYQRRRVPVAILGATGAVGQRFIQLLSRHPWFDIVALAASEKSEGKSYKKAVAWQLPTPIPENIANMVLVSCSPREIPCKLLFSALDSSIATDTEKSFAEAGFVVISNAKNHRMDPDVPLVIPEVNMDHIALVQKQPWAKNGGMIVTNPNCAVIGLALALKPLELEFGVECAHVVTLQSTSGAGFPGVPSLSILDNVIPYIQDEEQKLETELQKIFGTYKDSAIELNPITISAQCTRIPITEGHMEVVSVQLKEKATPKEIKRAWQEFDPPVHGLKLASSCVRLLHYFEEDDFPQPKLHRYLEKGMGIALGRLQRCSVLGHKFVLLSNNMIRGAAGGSIQIAELLVKQGMVFW